MDLQRDFLEFLNSYDEDAKNAIWREHSVRFHTFWQEKIMNGYHSPTDAEIDEIVRLLDTKGKGNSTGDEAVARVMVPQGAWRRMFNHFFENKSLRDALNAVITAADPESRARAIDEIYACNAGNKNNLTGKTASAVGSFLALSNPTERLSIVSLNDRAQVMQYLDIKIPDFNAMTIGKRVVQSEIAIMEYFKNNGISSNARTISEFFYPAGKKRWGSGTSQEPVDGGPGDKSTTFPREEYSQDQMLFYMESQLEDFLIQNWDKTDLGKKYELIEENGELVSQQYKTSIGTIDILAKEKRTNAYVVVELKRNQSSDDTIGQIARYMGWIDENKAESANTKGVIIAGMYDERLSYALRRIKDVEVFIYRVDFKLEEHKR